MTDRLPAPEHSILPEQRESLTSLGAIRDEVKTLVELTLDFDTPLEQKSYAENAKDRLIETRKAYDLLVQEGRAQEAEGYFDALFAYFVEREQEPAGPGTYHLKDWHNAIVRDFDNPQFHKDMMGHFMLKEEAARAAGNEKELDVAMKAKEFDANGLRRRGFHLNNETGADMVEQAQQTFTEVLEHWETVQDLTSQARVLYELAHIATETGDYAAAAEAHTKSAVVAEKAGDEVGTLIGKIKTCEALQLGSLEEPAQLVERLTEYATRMNELDTENAPNAREWVANALAHLAEAQEAAGQVQQAIVSWGAVLADPYLDEEGVFDLLGTKAQEALERLRP